MIELLFYVFAGLILISASVTVFSKNIMYSAFSLMFTFFGVAGIYVLLNADFIAVTQIMIYVGGILVLIIFGIMLTSKVSVVDIKEGFTGKIAYIFASIFAIGMAIFFVYLALDVPWISYGAAASKLPFNSTIQSLGTYLMTKYLIAFEVASVTLLIAIIGAAMIARRKQS